MMEDTKNLLKLRIRSALLGVAFTILTAMVLMFLFFSFTGRDVLVLKENTPVDITPAVVNPGETVTMHISFCKLNNAEGRIIRRLVSKNGEVFAPTENDTTGKRCYDDAPIPVPVPDQTPCGVYRVNYRVTYTTNPLHRSVPEEFNSEPFKVCK
jgi:hypothetical protein